MLAGFDLSPAALILAVTIAFLARHASRRARVLTYAVSALAAIAAWMPQAALVALVVALPSILSDRRSAT